MMRYSKTFFFLITVLNVILGITLVLVVFGIIPPLVQHEASHTSRDKVALPLRYASSEAGEDQEIGTQKTSTEVSLTTAPQTVSVEEQENINIYNRLNEAVVNITTEVISYNWFLEPIPQRGSTGSGLLIDKLGYILTNHHVVENATQVFVTLANGQRYSAEVVGTDVENDIAILHFNPPAGVVLSTIQFGTSANLQVGLKVLAIGNPFGLERTLTTGIISGLNRPVRVSRNLVVNNMIQTDASINPGNSGGPLLDTDGKLVGVNTAIFSPNGGSIGIGFAVPVDTVKRVIPELINSGSVQRGWIDIVPRQLFPQLVEYANLPVNGGILISEILPNGNAAIAGLRGGSSEQAVRYGRTTIYLGGDIIVGIGTADVIDIASLYAALETTKPGEMVTVHYVRNGREREVNVILNERPKQYQWE